MLAIVYTLTKMLLKIPQVQEISMKNEYSVLSQITYLKLLAARVEQVDLQRDLKLDCCSLGRGKIELIALGCAPTQLTSTSVFYLNTNFG